MLSEIYKLFIYLINEGNSSTEGLSLFGSVMHYNGTRSSTISYDSSEQAYKVISGSGGYSQSMFPIIPLTGYKNIHIELEIKGGSYSYPAIGIVYWGENSTDSAATGKSWHWRGIVPNTGWTEGFGDSITGYKTTTPSTSNNTWYKISIDLIDDECTFKLYDMSGALLRTDIKTLPHLDNNYTMYYGVSCGYDSSRTKWYRKIKAIKL